MPMLSSSRSWRRCLRLAHCRAALSFSLRFDWAPSMTKKKENPQKAGRKSSYTEDIADQVLELLVSGKSLVEITALDGMPGGSTIYRWRAADPVFRERYAHAREMQAETMADMVVAIPMTAEPFKADTALLKLQMDGLKWRAAKLRPNDYGEPALMRSKLARKEEAEYIAEMKNVTPTDEGERIPRDPKEIARIINFMMMKTEALEHKEKDE